MNSNASFCGAILAIVWLLAACTLPHNHPENIAKQAHMQHRLIKTEDFTLTTYARISQKNAPLMVYIEGDGLAWQSRTEPSLDPTPLHAIALQLAARDRSPNVVYIARPCQFTPRAQDPHCRVDYWTHKRFAPEVVASVNQAIDHFASETKSTALHLAGYSGGAAVAVLVAARRHDIAHLTTYAGNLDTEAMNAYHGVSLMPESLNPIDVAPRIAHISQTHYIGADDTVVPPHIVKRFVATQFHPDAKIISLPMDHAGNWEAVNP